MHPACNADARPDRYAATATTTFKVLTLQLTEQQGEGGGNS